MFNDSEFQFTSTPNRRGDTAVAARKVQKNLKL